MSYYVTVMQSPHYRQMTIEELLYGSDVEVCLNPNTTNTRTYETDWVSEKLKKATKVDVHHLVHKLNEFNDQYAGLREQDRKELFRTFYIPKKSGGLRRIDAPVPELMDALRRLKTIFECDFHALYHTSAFAYIKGRSTVDAVKRHQNNGSKWFGKYDLSNFFGSTTKYFVMHMFSMIFPFSEVMRYWGGMDALSNAIDLAFLDGVLPQGTPISPTITNVMMIPIDYKIANALRNYEHQQFVYTRYADDFLVSSKYEFDVRKIEDLMGEILKSFDAPFIFNEKKTRYGSSAGSNWNLGIMLNKDNQMTVGHENKRRFKAMLTSYVMDKKHGVDWDKHDVQVLEGHRNYYRMIEKDSIDAMVNHLNCKFNVNIVDMIKADLSA